MIGHSVFLSHTKEVVQVVEDIVGKLNMNADIVKDWQVRGRRRMEQLVMNAE